MNGFFCLKNDNAFFSRYLEFYVFDKFREFKLCDVIIEVTTY